MKELVCKIVVSETEGVARHLEVCTVNLPFAPAACSATDLQNIKISSGVTDLDSAPIYLWPDGSVKWLQIDFVIQEIQANETIELLLQTVGDAFSANVPLKPLLEYRQDCVLLNTEAVELSLDTTRLSTPISQIKNGADLEINSANGSRWEIQEIETNIVQNRLRAFVTQTALLSNKDEPGRNLRLINSIECKRYSTVVGHKITLHNPQSSKHENGLWDLGDKNSLYFSNFSLSLPIAFNQITYKTEKDGPRRSTVGALAIHQYTSGGDNEYSRNHRVSGQFERIQKRGFEIYAEDGIAMKGNRCDPHIILETTSGLVSLKYHRFWQEFPSAITANQTSLRVDLLPAYPHPHEIQPGESKSFEISLAWNTRVNESFILDDLQIFAGATTYDEAGVTLQSACGPESGKLERYEELVIDPHDFIAKREVIDEYGWRNFGDVYADHEAINAEPGSFISHYNNQYDLVYGFTRQYLRTSSFYWLELARDLAQHVCDIDVYKTNEDRPEYNNGLFWHTDHYVDAGLSTHRTFSREQPSQAYDGHSAGGGPGTEHCYTRGLALLHFVSGDMQFKDTCLSLCQWMLASFDAPRSYLDWAYRSLRTHLPRIVRYIRGDIYACYKYPLNRATGNYIRALLDAFSLTNDTEYLARVEYVVVNSAHPDDDIGLRNLDDVESSWSYTIYLTSLGEYLTLKQQINCDDQAFQFARSVLFKYARWMLEHETPYLSDPSRLEFPNHTWAAQDIRKTVVFYYASQFCSKSEKSLFRAKAFEYLDYVTSSLENEPTRHFTRIQAILLQNYDVIAGLCSNSGHFSDTPPVPIQTSPRPALARVLNQVFAELRQVSTDWSINSEFRWLKQRFRV